MRSRRASAAAAGIAALRSMPAEKAPPAPVTTPRRRPGSSRRRSQARASSRMCGGSRALRAAGRSMVITATAPSMSKRITCRGFLLLLDRRGLACGRLGGAAGGALGRLHIDRDRHLVADCHAARVERLVPGDAEVLAIDLGRRLRPPAGLAP